MHNLLQRIENLKGKQLYTVLAIVFILFTFTGVAIGYFTDIKLNSSENTPPNSVKAPQAEDIIYMEGYITYVNPDLYPKESISYKLTDKSGNTLVLLKSNDDKLAIVEGLKVKVSGKKLPNKITGAEVLSVKEVIVSNVTN